MWLVRVKYQCGGCNPFFSRAKRAHPPHQPAFFGLFIQYFNVFLTCQQWIYVTDGRSRKAGEIYMPSDSFYNQCRGVGYSRHRRSGSEYSTIIISSMNNMGNARYSLIIVSELTLKATFNIL